jgi:hypothetical protein
VTVGRERIDEYGDEFHDERCVGFADDPDEAQRLFDATRRSLELVLTGDTEDVDWAEVPPGVIL